MLGLALFQLPLLLYAGRAFQEHHTLLQQESEGGTSNTRRRR